MFITIIINIIKKKCSRIKKIKSLKLKYIEHFIIIITTKLRK